jgi:hypothetical protein
MEAGRATSAAFGFNHAPAGDGWQPPAMPMIGQLLVAAFLVLDGAAVVLGLCWLHRQRCISDITDLRYRDHPDRARRTLGQ